MVKIHLLFQLQDYEDFIDIKFACKDIRNIVPE